MYLCRPSTRLEIVCEMGGGGGGGLGTKPVFLSLARSVEVYIKRFYNRLTEFCVLRPLWSAAPLFYYLWVGESWVQLLGDQQAHARVIPILREYIWNAPAVLLFLPTVDDIGSLSFPPRRIPRWVTASRFLAGNREAELKPTTSLHSSFSVISCLSSPDPPAI